MRSTIGAQLHFIWSFDIFSRALEPIGIATCNPVIWSTVKCRITDKAELPYNQLLGSGVKNIGTAFSFPFRDPNWAIKFLIGGIFVLLSFLIIGIPVLYGYYVELLQRTRRREQYPLPEWTDLGVKFVLGIKYLVALFLYYMPLLLIFVPVFSFMILASLLGSEPVRYLGETTFLTSLFFVVFPYGLIINLLTPIISIRFSERERIRDAMKIGTVLHLFGKCWQDAVVITLIAIGTAILSALGLILFIVGILFTVFYSMIVRFHLYAQLASHIDELSTTTQVQTP